MQAEVEDRRDPTELALDALGGPHRCHAPEGLVMPGLIRADTKIEHNPGPRTYGAEATTREVTALISLIAYDASAEAIQLIRSWAAGAGGTRS